MKVVFDVDDTLVKFNPILESVLKKRNAGYSMSNIKTFDFNRSLSNESKEKLGISLDDKTNGLYVDFGYILDELTNINNFREEKFSIRETELLKELSKHAEIFFYTTTESREIAEFKLRQLDSYLDAVALQATVLVCMTNSVVKESKLVCGNRPVKISSSRKSGYKAPIDADIIVEDSLQNLSLYSDKTLKILIDMPYNQREFNPKYSELFENKNFIREYSIESVLERLISYAKAEGQCQ